MKPKHRPVDPDFQPPSLSARLGSWLMQAGRPGWSWLAGLETRLLADQMAAVDVRAPIFIAGVARSGSTILLQALASVAGLASARYRDYPPIWFPYWWTQLRDRLPLPQPAPTARAHADRIEVTPESPEALDEVLWMHYYRDRHDPAVDQRLAAAQECRPFTDFYRAHIRKLLHARGAERYLCKGNYNLLRLPLLLRMFPDARLVVPIRSPLTQVPSLQRQHRRFCALTTRWPHVARHLARSGHYEFGPQRRAECAGDLAQTRLIQAEFAAGDDCSAYARQWAASYGALAEMLSNDAGLADAVLLLRYEHLCAEPESALAELAAHCRLDERLSSRLLDSWPARLRAPDGHAALSPAERELVAQRCAQVAAHFGYDLGG